MIKTKPTTMMFQIDSELAVEPILKKITQELGRLSDPDCYAGEALRRVGRFALEQLDWTHTDDWPMKKYIDLFKEPM